MKKGKSFLCKVGSFVFAQLFIFSLVTVPVNTAGAAVAGVAPAVDKIKVSGTNGYVYQTYTAPGSDKLVIHIQDAHCNPGVQHNISGMLSELNANYNVDMIGIEGASRWVSTAILNAIPNKELREKVNQKLVNDSIIYGSTEFVANQDEFNALLFGVETRDLYIKNLLCYGEAAKARKDGLAQVDLISGALASLQPKMLNEKLNNYMDKKASYSNRETTFSEYLMALAQIAESESVSMDIYPNIKTVLKTYKLEDGIDFDKVDTERTEMIDKLSANLGKDKLEELVSNSLKFRTGKMEAAEYYTYLEKLMPQGNSYTNLRKYINYVQLNAGLNKNALTEERAKLEDAIKGSLAKTAEEKDFIALSEQVAMTKQLFGTESTRDEYVKLTSGKKSIQEILAFIKNGTEKHGVSFAWDRVNTNAWENSYKAGINFYTAALAREEVFIENLTKQMDVDGTKVAALVTGGFHTEKIEEALKAKNISYVVIRPKVAQRTPEGVYDKLMNDAINNVTVNTVPPPQSPATMGTAAAEQVGADPKAAGKAAEEAQAAVGVKPDAKGAAGTEGGNAKSFQATIYANVAKEAVTGTAQEIYDRMVKAVQGVTGQGIEVTFTEAKGIACISGNNIRLSAPTLRLFALIADKKLGGLDETQLTAYLTKVVIAHELYHKANPQADEKAVVVNEIATLKALGNDAMGRLIPIFRGGLQVEGIEYVGDTAYADFLAGIVAGQPDGALADALVTAQVRAKIEMALKALKPAPITIVDFKELGEAQARALDGKSIDSVMLDDVTVGALKHAPLVTASGVSVDDIVAAIPQGAGVTGVNNNVGGNILSKIGDRLVVEKETGDKNTDAVRAAVRYALANQPKDQVVVQQIEVGLLNTMNAEEVGLVLNTLRKANNKIQFINTTADGKVEVVSAPDAYKAYQTASDEVDLSKVGRVMRIVAQTNVGRYGKPAATQANTYYVTVDQLNGMIPVFAACAAGNNDLLTNGTIPAEFNDLFNLLFEGMTLTPADIKAYFSTPWLGDLLSRILPRIVPVNYGAILLTYTLSTISA